MASWMLPFVVCILILDCRHTLAQTNTSVAKVCRGTSSGIAQIDGAYTMYKKTYTDCTYVDGNLELVFLINQHNYNLSFLKDIQEITGYLLIVSIYADVIPLTSLNVIRGTTLFENKGRNYSVFMTNNFNPNDEMSVGLRELQLPSLHEIIKGDVFINNNPRLCHVHTIDWRDILPNKAFNVLVDSGDTSSQRCGQCSGQCPVLDGQRRCWGSADNMCQTYTLLSCSRQCDSRCMGPNPNDCCHHQCAAGCTGPLNSDCLACRLFDNDGRCEDHCPPEMIYSPTEYKHIPNPDAKYSFGALCVDECPPYMIANQGACVRECPPGRRSNDVNKCVDCEGACPKRCPGNVDEDYIMSHNIRSFEGCTVIQGAIRILQSTLDGDLSHNISSMRVDELSALESVREVRDYVQIQLSDPSFVSLRYLRNLRVIQGRRHTRQLVALEISHTSLKSLDLDSLTEIRSGRVLVVDNTHLCYANINWTRLISGGSRVMVRRNRDPALCARENEVCSRECSNAGCWGPADTQCLSCANFSLDGERCLSSCNSLPNIYQLNSTTCSTCHPECDGCTNATEASCIQCKNVKNGPYCVHKCPVVKYSDDNGICQDCHENCQSYGCTGPLNSVGDGACNACNIAVYDHDKEVTMCLPADSDCESGYFKYLNLPSTYGQMTGKQGCVPCHELCENCTAAGLSSCSTCKYYRQDDRCVHECGADYFTTMNDPSTCHHCHSHCMQCHGPTAADCVKCKHYRIFADLALGKSEHDKQDHNEPMPVSPLFNI